ncbi:MAG: hypothetical protein ACI4MC_04260 [Candidatus Coproplasma sp.]
MRIYFLSCRKAALKLNGQYAGVIGSVEKYADVADGEEVLAEVIADGSYLPHSFFIGQSLFKNPPPYLKVYLFGGGAQVRIERFEREDRGLNILEQKALNGLTVTLFELCGRTHISCDGQKSSLYTLPHCFANLRLTESNINGMPVMLAEGDNCLCVISAGGKQLFCGQVASYSTGDMLKVTVNYNGCAGYFAELEYGFNGQQLTLTKSVVKKRYAVDNAVLHFAFFEALLYGADCGEYLSEELQSATEALKEYLGDYAEVTVPYKAFYDSHGDICAAALAYPVKENLFEIKYVSVQYKDEKIDNVSLLDCP